MLDVVRENGERERELARMAQQIIACKNYANTQDKKDPGITGQKNKDIRRMDKNQT